jgi:plasmid stabilization system protein ParE
MVKNQFILTSQAKQDIKDIWLYITNDSIRAADNVLEYLEQAFYKLANNPNIGSKREDLTNKPLRFWIVYNYYIIYEFINNFREWKSVIGLAIFLNIRK